VRAWRAVEHGAPRDVLRLDEVDEPTPEPGEVQIRVDAVTLNFNDIDGIHGRYRTVPVPAPYIPGMEVLGTAVAVGNGVDRSLLGTRVVAIPSGAHGGYAEVAVAPATMTFPMPESVPLPGAAAVLMPFHLAALSLLFVAGPLAELRPSVTTTRPLHPRPCRPTCCRPLGAPGPEPRAPA